MKLAFMLLLCCYCLQSRAVQETEFPDSFRSTHFLFFYALTTGINQLSTQKRIDKAPQNDIPDYVESIATQLEAANAFYTGPEFKLHQPFLSERYLYKVDHYGIYIKKFTTGNGSTSDEIQKDENDSPILKISLSNSLSTSNLTPAHELFHTFQNGYSMIKNGWFLEGSARWVENAFRDIADIDDNLYQKTLPQNNPALDTLVGLSYDADFFWNRLTYLCDPASPKNDPKSSVKSIYGLQFMNAFLENLKIQSNAATRDRCYSFYQWPEQDQKYNDDNNAYLFKAIQQTVLSQCPAKRLQSQELNNFLQAIDEHIKRFEKSDPFYDAKTQRLYLPRVFVENDAEDDSLFNPTEASNSFKVVLELIPYTNPVRFSIHNSTPMCHSTTQSNSTIFDSRLGILKIPTVEFLPFGNFRVVLTRKPNTPEFELSLIKHQ